MQAEYSRIRKWKEVTRLEVKQYLWVFKIAIEVGEEDDDPSEDEFALSRRKLTPFLKEISQTRLFTE